ncbi:F0F1 ATP synthase subunit delta [Candidatus Saccharibacteria bacterium]|nr:MAG: F0F1 ATP synthase subunit delta [Candidatus Saccharibacteria bacterium]
MADKLSRSKLAAYVADEMLAGRSLDQALLHVAGYLVESGRIRECTLVVRAIEDTLARRGTVIASVTTARPLDSELRQRVEALIAANTLYIREKVDPSVIGGVLVETPGLKLDATIKHKLLALSRAKI